MCRDLIKISLLISFLIATTGSLHSQNLQRLDSLIYRLEMAKDDSVRVITLIEISEQYSFDDLSMGLRYAERALEIARLSKRSDLLSLALSNMGFVCFQYGLLELAARHYYEFRDLQKQLGDQERVLAGMVNIGSVKLMMQKFEESRDDLLEVLRLIEEIDAAKPEPDTLPRAELPIIFNNLGVAYENLGYPEDAIEYYRRGATIARRIPGQELMLARLLNNLGKLYGELGRPDEAIRDLTEALELRRKAGDTHGQASSYRNLSHFYFSLNDYAQAFDYAYKGLALAERVGSIQLLSNFSGLLFSYFDNKNQADSALKFLKKEKEYVNQLNSEEAHREITRLEVTSQFQERELLRQMEQRRKEQRYVYTGALILLVATILGLLYFLAQSRARRLRLANVNIQLEFDKNILEKASIEKELELKNKEFTTNVMYQINKNELIQDIIKKLLRLSLKLNTDQKEYIQDIIRDMEKAMDEKVWEEFELRFHNVHNEFYEKLNALCPGLSINEKRLCSFLRLNMTTKEISSITGQSPKSIETARTRLRKKLNLTNTETSLTDFLEAV